MTIDDDDGATPLSIHHRHTEILSFIQMRRHIEEVNLCVTLMEHINGVPAKSIFHSAAVTTAKEMEVVQSSEAGESEEINHDEWHRFPISDTPMTFPAFTVVPTATTQDLR
uniref:Uncharacterized protein n=1 Tax=Noccaea caerulescens TaxID=107243 RepID=A0A1J3FU65_NOCCA